jgi:alpha-beta hydrolase superfamily lysophospholipase
MLKTFGFGVALLMAGAVPSFAQDTCPEPPIPTVVDGSTATRDQLVAGIAAVKAYIAASDTYQSCINDYVTAAKAQADKDKKPMDKAIIQTEGDRVTANQNNKQKVGDAINVSIGAFKKAHPT